MISRAEIVSRLLDPGIIPVIRADNAKHVMPACEALLAGGLTTLEITMTTPNALALIREASQRFGQRATIGVGTVMTAEMCRAATEAGASFVVTPVTRLEIVRAAHAAERVIILGAYTPTEAQSAHDAGADLIKIFPAERAAYIKAIRGPMPHLKIVPTGGVNLQTGPEFFAAGCVALGVGTSLVSPKILREEHWAELTRLAGEFVAMARKAPRK
ncbi:MAG: bifunctional 4-hydroxy-2-oxoglutarate aldolase/2-dehydro-3-deoxy-phosphogluconate aldolase [Verrucomicrobiota bacterium]|jgi:2-dehydro-3-deoxyphosphogluconate aldolase/(4S)-4-hydroxy-2-oxoglutarate aldolase